MALPARRHARRVATVLAAGLACGAARADYVATYVDVACDAAHDRALVRFAYADSTDPPVFATLPDAVDAGLSRKPARAQATEASCRAGRHGEVKVRLLPDPLGSGFWSVWSDGIRVAHDSKLYPASPDGQVLYGFVIDRHGVRECRFDTGDPYATGGSPVSCRASRPIAGRRDAVEFPPRGTHPPRPGAIRLVRTTDAAFCRHLVRPLDAKLAQPWARPPFEAVSTDGLGRTILDDEWQPVDGISRLSSIRVDLWGNGQPVVVYAAGSATRIFDRTTLVVPPAPLDDATLHAVFEVAHSVTEEATARHWPIVGGFGIPPWPSGWRTVNARLVQGQDGFFAVQDGDEQPDTLVFRAAPDRSFAEVCAFETVQPHL